MLATQEESEKFVVRFDVELENDDTTYSSLPVAGQVVLHVLTLKLDQGYQVLCNIKVGLE